MDKQFLFETFRKETELILKKHNLADGISFVKYIEEEPNSVFNIIMEETSNLMGLLDENSEESDKIKELLENIFGKYDHFSEVVDNKVCVYQI